MVRGLFDGTGVELEFERDAVSVSYGSVEEAIRFLETNAPPLVAARQHTQAEGTWPALRDELFRNLERRTAPAPDGIVDTREYLLVLGRKR